MAKKIFYVCLALAATWLPAKSAAQEHRFELSPYLGLGWGGEVQVREEVGEADLERESGEVLGLRFGVRLSERWQLELGLCRAESELRDDNGLFAESPGGSFEPGTRGVLDVELQTFEVGVLREWGRGDRRPYLVVGVGWTRIEPAEAFPLGPAENLSLAAGAGVKLWTGERFGFRFEGRLGYVDTSDEDAVAGLSDNTDCTGDCVRVTSYEDGLLRAELTVALLWRF